MSFIDQFIKSYDERLLNILLALYERNEHIILIDLLLTINHGNMLTNEKITDKIQKEILTTFTNEHQQGQEIIQISKKLKENGDIEKAKKETAHYLTKNKKDASEKYHEVFNIMDEILDHLSDSYKLINTIEILQQKTTDSKNINLKNTIYEILLNMNNFVKILNSIQNVVHILQDKRVTSINKITNASNKLK